MLAEPLVSLAVCPGAGNLMRIGMYLEVNGNVVNEPVSDAMIEKTVYSLTGQGDSFMILSVDEMTYMQASGDQSGGFVLEYQDGSLEQHYYCADPDISAGKVTDAFRSYFARDDKWRKKYHWQRGNGESNNATGIVKHVILFFMAAILAFVAWKYTNPA